MRRGRSDSGARTARPSGQGERGEPGGRFLRAEDAANVVLFLASDPSESITGEVLVADGGKSRGIRY